jgi:hypothetical protein
VLSTSWICKHFPSRIFSKRIYFIKICHKSEGFKNFQAQLVKSKLFFMFLFRYSCIPQVTFNFCLSVHLHSENENGKITSEHLFMLTETALYVHKKQILTSTLKNRWEFYHTMCSWIFSVWLWGGCGSH